MKKIIFAVCIVIAASFAAAAQNKAAIEYDSLMNMRFYEETGSFLVEGLEVVFPPAGASPAKNRGSSWRRTAAPWTRVATSTWPKCRGRRRAATSSHRARFARSRSSSVSSVDEKAVSVEIPPSVVLTVTDAPEGIRGDSANNVQKAITVETGITVQAPLFIKTGEKIKIDTRTRKYMERA